MKFWRSAADPTTLLMPKTTTIHVSRPKWAKSIITRTWWTADWVSQKRSSPTKSSATAATESSATHHQPCNFRTSKFRRVPSALNQQGNQLANTLQCKLSFKLEKETAHSTRATKHTESKRMPMLMHRMQVPPATTSQCPNTCAPTDKVPNRACT